MPGTLRSARRPSPAPAKPQKRIRVKVAPGSAEFRVDPTGQVSTWSLAAARLSGHPPESIVGRHHSQLFIPEDVESGVPDKALRVALVEGRYEAEGWRLRQDGARFPAAVTIKPFREQGRHGGFRVTIRDLSLERGSGGEAREQAAGQAPPVASPEVAEDSLARRAVQQSAVAELGARALHGIAPQQLMEDAVRLVAEHLATGYAAVFERTREGDALVARALVGWEGALPGGPLAIGLRPGSQAALTLASPEPIVVDDFALEARFPRHPQQRARGVRSGMSVAIGGLDEPFGLLSCDDVRTRRFTADEAAFLDAIARVLAAALDNRRTQEALREAEQRFRLLVEAIRDHAIFMLDTSGRVATWNAGAQRLLGYSAEEIVGRRLPCLYALDDARAGRADRELTMAAATGRFEQEKRCQRKDGSRFWASILVSPIRDADGRLRGFSQVVRDIGERKRIDRMKDEFFSLVSRELRTPLASVHGSLRLLDSGVVAREGPEAAALVQIACKNAGRLVRLVDDILDVARIETGALDITLERLDVVTLARQAIEANRPFAEQFGVRLRLGESVGEGWVRADAGRLMQVLTTLLAQAVRHPPRGNVGDVTVSRHGPAFRVAVAGGLPPPDADGRGGRRPRHGAPEAPAGDAADGSRLALAIAQALVERMHGALGWETRTRSGTSVYVELPEAPDA